MYVHIIIKCILKLLELIKYFLESTEQNRIMKVQNILEYIRIEQNRT